MSSSTAKAVSACTPTATVEKNNAKNTSDQEQQQQQQKSKNKDVADLWLTLDRELRLNIGNSLKCGICLSTLTNPMRTPCVHAFCRDCIHACIVYNNVRRCPECNTAITKRSLQPFAYIQELSDAYKATLREFGLVPTLYNPNFTTMTQKVLSSSSSAEDTSHHDDTVSPQAHLDRLDVATTWQQKALPQLRANQVLVPMLQKRENDQVVEANFKACQPFLLKLPTTQDVQEQAREQQWADQDWNEKLQEEDEEEEEQQEESETSSSNKRVSFCSTRNSALRLPPPPPRPPVPPSSVAKRPNTKPSPILQTPPIIAATYKNNNNNNTNKTPTSTIVASTKTLPFKSALSPILPIAAAAAAAATTTPVNDRLLQPQTPKQQQQQQLPSTQEMMVEDSFGALHLVPSPSAVKLHQHHHHNDDDDYYHSSDDDDDDDVTQSMPSPGSNTMTPSPALKIPHCQSSSDSKKRKFDGPTDMANTTTPDILVATSSKNKIGTTLATPQDPKITTKIIAAAAATITTAVAQQQQPKESASPTLKTSHCSRRSSSDSKQKMVDGPPEMANTKSKIGAPLATSRDQQIPTKITATTTTATAAKQQPKEPTRPALQTPHCSSSSSSGRKKKQNKLDGPPGMANTTPDIVAKTTSSKNNKVSAPPRQPLATPQDQMIQAKAAATKFQEPKVTTASKTPSPHNYAKGDHKEEEEEENKEQQVQWKVGDIVHIQSRTWPGVNKPGGVARIVKVWKNDEENTDFQHQCYYDVAYVLGGKESKVDHVFVSAATSVVGAVEEEIDDNSKRQRRRRRTQNATELPMSLLQALEVQGFDTTGNRPMKTPYKKKRPLATSTNTHTVATNNATKRKSTATMGGRLPPQHKKSKRSNSKTTKASSSSTTSLPPPATITPNRTSTTVAAAPISSTMESNNDDVLCKQADAHYQDIWKNAMTAKELHIVTSMLDPEDMELLKMLASSTLSPSLCGDVQVRLSDSVGKKTTLCILPLDGNRPKVRTVKALQSALAGIPMIAPEWIHQVIAAAQLVTPTQFVRSLPTKSVPMTKGGVARLAIDSTTMNKLLDHTYIFFSGNFPERQRTDMDRLAKEAGAKVWKTADQVVHKLKQPPQSQQQQQHRVVIVCHNSKIGPASLEKQLRRSLEEETNSNSSVAMTQVLVVSSSWLFDSICCAEPLPPHSFAPPVSSSSKNRKATDLWERCCELYNNGSSSY